MVRIGDCLTRVWVSDQIEQARLISFADLADALERLDADPLVFLPDDEITKRIARLRKKSKGR